MVLDLTGFSWVILLWGLSGSFWQMAPGTGIICRLTWAGDPEYSFISMCDVSDGMSDTGRRYPGTCLSHMSSSYGHPALSPSSLRWFKHLIWYLASDGLADKEFTCNAGDPHFISWVRNIAWRKERLPTPVFWPGEFHEQYSPWGWKESDTTEAPS